MRSNMHVICIPATYILPGHCGRPKASVVTAAIHHLAAVRLEQNHGTRGHGICPVCHPGSAVATTEIVPPLHVHGSRTQSLVQ
jgi:hypothetical protein